MLRRLALLLLAVICAAPSQAAAPAAPLVLAAASLQEALTDAADAWARHGHPRPVLAFAASSALARQIAAGEYPITLMNYSMLTTNLKQQGAPTDYFALDPVHLWFGMVGVNKSAPHPNAARLAANFLLSREAQSYSSQNGGRIPTRLDVDSNPKDVREKLSQKKAIFVQLSAEQMKSSQKVFDEIFTPR